MNAHERELSVTSISREEPVASKPHRCVICDREIPIGEKHKRWTYRLNAALDKSKALRSVRFHIECPRVLV